MRQDYQKLFNNLNSPEMPRGIFDKIISAIYHEQELRQTKKFLFSFLSLLIVSIFAIPFSAITLINQISNSGISYLISAAFSDLATFFNFWQNFTLAIIESLPITGLLAFTISLVLALFTFRLFLHKKRLLFGYLRQSFS